MKTTLFNNRLNFLLLLYCIGIVVIWYHPFIGVIMMLPALIMTVFLIYSNHLKKHNVNGKTNETDT